MPVIRARAIEFAELFRHRHPEEQQPHSHSDWSDQIFHTITSRDDIALHHKLAFRDPIEIAFAELSGNHSRALQIQQNYIGRFCSEIYQSHFMLDLDSRLVLPSDPAFNRVYNSPNRKDPDIMAERAKKYLAENLLMVKPVCQRIYRACDGQQPDDHDLRNARLGMDPQNGEFFFRAASLPEMLADTIFGRLRDARAGSLRVNNQTIDGINGNPPDPRDRFANWLVDQPWFRPLATFLAEEYSAIMMPDTQKLTSIPVEEWQAKNRKKLFRRPPGL